MEAVIQTGGKQYIVSKGDQIKIGKVLGNPGEDITFDDVLLVTGDKTIIGTPKIEGAKVTGTILAQEKDRKIIVFKYKRRKGYHKKQGHRQDVSRVEIKDIKVS